MRTARSTIETPGEAAADQDPEQLHRIEKIVTELHQREPEHERQHMYDRAAWTTVDWIRTDWANHGIPSTPTAASTRATASRGRWLASGAAALQ
jgi:hypothetical protein